MLVLIGGCGEGKEGEEEEEEKQEIGGEVTNPREKYFLLHNTIILHMKLFHLYCFFVRVFETLKRFYSPEKDLNCMSPLYWKEDI